MEIRLDRRAFVGLAAGSAAAAATTNIVVALDYPARPVRMIVGLAAGGPTDLVARTIAAPRQLPVGAIMAVTGTPLFLLLLRQVRSR